MVNARKIIKTEKLKFRTSEQLITDNEEKAEKFYKQALKDGQEGVMIKNHHIFAKIQQKDFPRNNGNKIMNPLTISLIIYGIITTTIIIILLVRKSRGKRSKVRSIETWKTRQRLY